MRDREEDIEKYFNGELTPAEMHALEKKALSDPFLADALEGGSQVPPREFSGDLAGLRERMGSRDKKVVPIWAWPMRIAAGIAVVGVVAYLVIRPFGDSNRERIAENKITQKGPETTAPKPVEEEQNDDQINQSGKAGAESEKKDETQSDNAPPPVVQERNSTSDVAPEKREAEHVGEQDVGLSETSTMAAGADHQVPPTESIPSAARGYISSQAPLDVLEKSVLPANKKVITGTVLDAEDGRAIPGVNVLVNGTTTGTTTDEDGKYVIATDSLEAGLLFTFIGYENKVVDAITTPNLDVMLDPDIAELNEVVVVGYGGTKRDDLDADPIIEIAEPAGGRKAYKQYLAENLRYPEQALNNSVEGRVTVQFTIEPTGKMTDFKILKGLGYGCEEEVIRLIQQGPRWKPSRRNTEPVTDKVKVRMKFSLPKK
jgi:TonB family protein